MRKLTVWTVLVVLGIILTACSSTEEEPLEYTRSISGEIAGGTITVSYPDSWFAVENASTLRIASRENGLGDETPPRREGDTSGGVTAITPDALLSYGLETDDSMNTVVRTLAESLGADVDNLILGNPVSFTVGDRNGSVISGTARGEGESVGRVAIAVVDEGDVIGVVTLGTFGDDPQPAEIAQMIAESFEYTAGSE